MLKRLKCIVCVILTMAMVIIHTPYVHYANAASVEQSVSTNTGKNSERVLFSLKGEQASTELSKTLCDLGIQINASTTIAIISSEIEEEAHAVQVTNTEGNLITTHKLVAISNDGSIGRINALSERSEDQAYVMGDTADLLNGGLVFIWAIQFNYYPSGFGLDLFRPLYMQIYYRNTGGHTVERLQMYGTCAGNEYTYPGLVRISSEDYYHEMIIDEQSPSANRYYVNTNAYRSDRVIGNAPEAGGYVINFYYRVNGRNYYDVADVSIFVRSL